MKTTNKKYYIHKERDQTWSIRQTRLQHNEREHPHDVCAVTSTLKGIKEMAELSIFIGKTEYYDY